VEVYWYRPRTSARGSSHQNCSAQGGPGRPGRGHTALALNAMARLRSATTRSR
jgi:hypothetical protein